MKDMLAPDKLGTLVRQMIGMGSTDFVIGFMDKIDMIIDGGHLMQAAIYMKDTKMIKALIKGGANLTKAPLGVPPLHGHDDLLLPVQESHSVYTVRILANRGFDQSVENFTRNSEENRQRKAPKDH